MLKSFDIDEISDLQYRMKCAADMVGFVQEVIESGQFSDRDYSDAMFGAYNYLASLVKELGTLCNGSKERAKNT